MAKFKLAIEVKEDVVEMYEDIRRQLYSVYIEEVREMSNRLFDIRKSLYDNNWGFYEDLKRDYPTIFEEDSRKSLLLNVGDEFGELEERREGVKKFNRILQQLCAELNLNGGAESFLHHNEKLIKGIYEEVLVRRSQGETNVITVERDNFRGSLRV